MDTIKYFEQILVHTGQNYDYNLNGLDITTEGSVVSVTPSFIVNALEVVTADLFPAASTAAPALIDILLSESAAPVMPSAPVAPAAPQAPSADIDGFMPVEEEDLPF